MNEDRLIGLKRCWLSVPVELRTMLVWVVTAAAVGILGGAYSGLEPTTIHP